jgi:formylglycine-generating enzyme required for sulfatase activity/serine/threonine protein kinase
MNPQSSRRDPLGITGTVIADKYRMAHAVGEGGFSVVYLAEHTIWRQPVAIKCFKVLANAPEDQRDRLLEGFIQEGKIMASLSSRSAAIVQARDVGTFTTPAGEWLPYMVLEWLDGKPLDIILYEERRAGLPARNLHELLALLDPAAGALEIVHSRGIAHRDIKPANFFVMGDPRGVDAYVKVLDFGIAKVMAEHAEMSAALAMTGKEITAFTPNYGAPEQFSRSHGATGPWTDVFAMALILVEILRGGIPALDGSDLIQMAVASRDPHRRPTPRSFGVQVPDAVERVFLTALAVNPGERYATMGQFWGALYQAIFPDSAGWSPVTAGGRPMTSPGFTPPSMVNPPSSTNPSMGVVSTTSPGGLGPPMPAQQPMPPQAYDPAYGQQQPMGGQPTPPQPYGPPNASTHSALLAPSTPVRRSSTGPALFAGIALGALALGGIGAYTVFSNRPPAVGSAVPSAASVPLSLPVSAPASASAAPARRTECPAGMVLVPGGRFFMGSDDGAFKLWQPAHKVTLDTFCIDVNEVTAGDYKACSDVGECKRPPEIPDFPKSSESISDAQHEKNKKAYSELCTFGKPGLEKHPINCVDWSLADGYCKQQKKRLPTEAEWEFAARGSDGRKFPWGDEAGDMEHMNACGLECNKWELAHAIKQSPRMYDTDDGYPGTAPVGSFPKGKTKFGAYDFIGNVWEWTSDWFETYHGDEVVNPTGAPAGDRKAIRGGGFNGGVQLWLNPAFRYHQLATASSHGIGFRCATNL